jgi:hypothetical protein
MVEVLVLQNLQNVWNLKIENSHFENAFVHYMVVVAMED